jgi:hypothetical protein
MSQELWKEASRNFAEAFPVREFCAIIIIFITNEGRQAIEPNVLLARSGPASAENVFQGRRKGRRQSKGRRLFPPFFLLWRSRLSLLINNSTLLWSVTLSSSLNNAINKCIIKFHI